MTEAAANSAPAESDSVRPSLTLGEAAQIDFEEPDEANEEVETATQPTSDTDETEEDGQEADEDAAEGDEPAESDEDDAEANEAEDVVITLKGGEQVKLDELKLGYMRDRDYRHKTTEIANSRRDLESMTTRVANTANAIADFLIAQLPPEPSPALAMQNPTEYTRQKAMYDVALNRVQQVIDLGNEPKAVSGELTQTASEETLAVENARLLESFPNLAKPEAREKFFADAFATARELGWSDEELTGATDHRLFKLAHYARIGLAAEQAKSKALTKVQRAPPAALKAKQKPQVAQTVQQSRDAMKRLSKSGSIKDALLIDFD